MLFAKNSYIYNDHMILQAYSIYAIGYNNFDRNFLNLKQNFIIVIFLLI